MVELIIIAATTAITSKGRGKHISWMFWHNFPDLMYIFKLKGKGNFSKQFLFK